MLLHDVSTGAGDVLMGMGMGNGDQDGDRDGDGITVSKIERRLDGVNA